jgi:hypothetical protein
MAPHDTTLSRASNDSPRLARSVLNRAILTTLWRSFRDALRVAHERKANAKILRHLRVKGFRSQIETSDIEAMTHMIQDAFVIIVVDDSTLFFAEAITKVNHLSITNAQDLIVDLL